MLKPARGRDERILAISVDALPKIGGVSLLAHHVANSFVDLGAEVTFLGPVGSTVPHQLQRRYRLCEDWESDVKQRAGKDAYMHDIRISALVSRIIDRNRITRVILFHPFYYGTGALDAAASRGIPVSVMFHGFEMRSVVGRQGYPVSLKRLVDERRLSTLRERTFNTIGRASQIIVNSSYTETLFSPLDLKIPVTVCGCGVEAEVFRGELARQPSYEPEAKSLARTKSGLLDLPTLTYVGRLVETKRVDRLIELVAASAGLQGVVIGTGPAEAALRERAEALGVTERVHFAGHVSESEKWDLLRTSDFLALLSGTDERTGNVEGFGIALLEGIAAACVPLTSGTGGMKDIVSSPDQNGIVLPLEDDADVQAAHLSSLVSDVDKMRSIVTNARQQLERRYTWDRVAGRILESWGISLTDRVQ